jgi:hypothetical protein
LNFDSCHPTKILQEYGSNADIDFLNDKLLDWERFFKKIHLHSERSNESPTTKHSRE